VRVGNLQFEAAGGMGSVDVFVRPLCRWTAVSTADWITIDSGQEGILTGEVKFTVAANAGDTARSAKLLISGQSVIVEQAAANGSCALVTLASGQGVVGHLSKADCRSRFVTNFSQEVYADRYVFSGSAGERVALHLSAPASAPARLVLADSNGPELAQ